MSSSALTRRDLAKLLPLTIAGLVTAKNSKAQDIIDFGKLPELPPEIAPFAYSKDQNDLETKGVSEPTSSQKATADSIVTNIANYAAAKRVPPHQIAQRFIQIAQNVGSPSPFDPSWPGFMRAWPATAPANPLIRDHFFGSTHTNPEGDRTAWCSAFINWTIDAARFGYPEPANLLPGTKSAASSSWRNWGTAITFDENNPSPKGGVPRIGDLVVFVEKADPAHGHVAYFRAIEGSSIRFFGGNHLEGHPVRHVISEKRLPLWGPVLEIHSIRTDPGLHISE